MRFCVKRERDSESIVFATFLYFIVAMQILSCQLPAGTVSSRNLSSFFFHCRRFTSRYKKNIYYEAANSNSNENKMNKNMGIGEGQNEMKKKKHKYT